MKFRHCYSECRPKTLQVLGWVLVLKGFICTKIYNFTARLRNIWSILINVLLAFFKEQYTENKMYMNCRAYLVTVLGRSSSSRVKAICPLCINKEKSNMFDQKQEFFRNNLGHLNFISCLLDKTIQIILSVFEIFRIQKIQLYFLF